MEYFKASRRSLLTAQQWEQFRNGQLMELDDNEYREYTRCLRAGEDYLNPAERQALIEGSGRISELEDQVRQLQAQLGAQRPSAGGSGLSTIARVGLSAVSGYALGRAIASVKTQEDLEREKKNQR
jgi:hypothetical protein